MDAKQMEEFEALERRFIDSLTPEQRLAGLRPEDRLVDLSEGEAVLALPDAVLLALTDAFVETLPDDIRRTVCTRRALAASKP